MPGSLVAGGFRSLTRKPAALFRTARIRSSYRTNQSCQAP
ncbi:hypothetical protein P355_3894 [Burkholderia cenocepacia KC-01]|nr:hypothetical protein P355_3894 [Burkholderia cenocepacia KC-01]